MDSQLRYTALEQGDANLIDAYSTDPEIEDILNVLGGQITDDQMREINYQVDFEDRAAEDVAKEFLVKKIC